MTNAKYTSQQVGAYYNQMAEYYRLAWGGNLHVGYWPDVAEWVRETAELPAPSIIILTPDVQKGVDAHLRGAYNQQMMYGLRPGVVVNVYVREDLWEAFLEAASKR